MDVHADGMPMARKTGVPKTRKTDVPLGTVATVQVHVVLMSILPSLFLSASLPQHIHSHKHTNDCFQLIV